MHYLLQSELQKGSKILFINIPNAQTVFFASAVRGGFYYAKNDQYELPHLLEHLAFLGNQKYPDYLKFMFEIEKDGAYQNASTSPIAIKYFYSCGKKEFFDILELGLAQLTGPLFKEEDIENEKQVIYREWERRLDDYGFGCSHELGRLLIPKKPEIKERMKSLKNINRDDIFDFYQKHHTAKNTFFLIAGDFLEPEIKKTKEIINEHLTDYSEGKELEIVYPKMGDYKQKIVLTEKETNQNYFELTFIYPQYEEKIGIPMRVLNAIYNQGASSRLFNLTRKLGLSYAPKTGFDISQDYSEFFVYDKAVPEKALELFEVFVSELVGLAAGDFSDAELTRAKGYVAGAMETNYNLPSDFASWYGTDFILGEELIDLNEYIEGIRKVKKEEIIEAASKFIKPDSWSLSVLGKDVKKEEKSYRTILKKHLQH